MTERKHKRSGLIIFSLFAVLLLGAIGATVLLANNFRNLNLLLTHFGYAPVEIISIERIPRSYELKGKRLPRPKGAIPARLLFPVTSDQTHFVRAIRELPQALCEALRRAGFVNSEWKEGAFDKDSWECQSYREFPGEREGAGATSSAFLSIRGNAETRISSFRIKLNIEDKATRGAVTDAALLAIRMFLDDVRWDDAPEVLTNIRALREFDIIRFGNRILLKKEFSDTPRYNFIITPDRRGSRGSYLPDYFNQKLWLPLREKSAGGLDAASTPAHTPPN